MLIRLKPKGKQSVASLKVRGTRTCTTADVKAVASSRMLLERNTVNPVFRLSGGRLRRKVGSWDAGQRNAGASQSRPVMGWIGVISPYRESGQTSSRSSITRAQAESPHRGNRK
jgi:hypothetical protein